jgi:carbon storage regulator
VLSSGANNNVTAPTLTTATLSGSTLTVQGTFTAPTANVPYVLEFFANPTGDAEGKVYLGSKTINLANRLDSVKEGKRGKLRKQRIVTYPVRIRCGQLTASHTQTIAQLSILTVDARHVQPAAAIGSETRPFPQLLGKPKVLARTLPEETEPPIEWCDPFLASWRSVMLILTRKPGEKIVIGNGITLTVVEVHGDRIRVGLDAPDQVRILRGELIGRDELPEADPDLEGKPPEWQDGEASLDVSRSQRPKRSGR